MAVFEANDMAINTALVAVITKVHASVGNNHGFAVRMQGLEPVTFKFSTVAAAEEARSNLIALISTGTGAGYVRA